MPRISVLDRILLLLTGLLAAYQVVVGIDGLATMAVACYTIGFGVLLVAALLLIILGFEALESPAVVIAAALIPLSLSLGLVDEFLPQALIPYGVFTVVGFLALLVTRLAVRGRIATLTLIVVHGIAGLVIFLLPFWLALRGEAAPGFALVGVGGGLIGLGGLLLSFLKVGRPLLPQRTILAVLPGLLLATTAAFVAGFILR